jgi:hypothetical protein
MQPDPVIQNVLPILEGKLLIVFSDPGGAKPMLALASAYPGCTVVSDRVYGFFEDFTVQVHSDEGLHEQFLNKVQPDIIVSGTSYRSDIEKKYHRLAAKWNIPCFAYVDHSTSMRSRFELSDGSFVLPDEVWVVDEFARKQALLEGIPSAKVRITPNPYLEWLSLWKPSIGKSELLHQLGVTNERTKLLLFAPDPLSNVNGLEKYGIDERGAWQYLAQALNDVPPGAVLVVVKLHPNQNREYLTEVILESNIPVQVISEEIHHNTLLYHADIVIGMFSNILIEAEVLHKPIIRIPGNPATDPLGHKDIGLVVHSPEVLKNGLMDLLRKFD